MTYFAKINGNIINPGSGIAGMWTKTVSDDLRHSSDAVVNHGNTSYQKIKTFTFTNGVKGTLRIKFAIASESVNAGTAGILTKNGATPNGHNLGAEQTHNTTTYDTKSQDINVGTLNPGETIDLWTKRTGTHAVLAKEFRIYYTQDDIGVATS